MNNSYSSLQTQRYFQLFFHAADKWQDFNLSVFTGYPHRGNYTGIDYMNWSFSEDSGLKKSVTLLSGISTCIPLDK